MMLLDVDGVRAGYGRTEVLHGVNLRVPAGRCVALLGSNGAGKSTLLKTIAGFLTPTSGSIRFHGSEIDRMPTCRRARQGICLIPEGRGIFRRLSVRENLAMQVGGKGVRQAIELAASYFPILGDRLSQQAGTLSGGQQQMLALARALVTEPEIVLADELSVGLAPVVVDEIFEAVTTMRTQGRAILIVEQYVDRAIAVADYVYILKKGEIAFVGEPQQCATGAVFEQYLGGAA
jgi:branched-chain amino acid transport system ATP-binding protein